MISSPVRLPVLTLVLASALALAPAAQAGGPFRPAPHAPASATAGSSSARLAPLRTGQSQQLSDERVLSRWAYVDEPVWARTSASRKGRKIKRLSYYTPDRTDELVLTLRRRRMRDGSEWVLVRLPMRPNNRTGWVPREALGGFNVVTTKLRINRSSLRATLFRRGHVVWQARVGVGKRGTPTPAGNFYVRERLVPSNPHGLYGTFAFGTSAYSDVLTDWPGGGMVGVHGTDQPNLIPGRPSHGCVRVRNGPISKLSRLMPLGTPISIG
jgi:hypothetical protein